MDTATVIALGASLATTLATTVGSFVALRGKNHESRVAVLNDRLGALHETIARLEALNEALTEKNAQLEEIIRDLKRRLDDTKDDLERMTARMISNAYPSGQHPVRKPSDRSK